MKEALQSVMSSFVTVEVLIESPVWVSSRDQQLLRATADKEPEGHHGAGQQQRSHDTALVFSCKAAQQYSMLLEELKATQQQLARSQQECQGWQKKFHKEQAECSRLRYQVQDLQAHQTAAALDEFVQLEALLESHEQQSAAAESALSELEQQRDQMAIVNTVLSRKRVDASCRSAKHQADALALAEELKRLQSCYNPKQQQQQVPYTAHKQQSGTPNANQGCPLQPLTPEDSTADSMQQCSAQYCDVAMYIGDQAPAVAPTTTPMQHAATIHTASNASSNKRSGSTKTSAMQDTLRSSDISSSSSSTEVVSSDKGLKYERTSGTDSKAAAAVGPKQQCSAQQHALRWRI